MAFYPLYYPFYDKNEVFVYVEKYNKENNYVLFDFVDSNEFIFFGNTASFQYDWETRPTMVEVLNYTQRDLQEGVTYRITNETLIYFQQRIQIVEDSLIIGFRLALNNTDNTLFGPSKSFNEVERFWRNMDDTFNSELHPIELDFGKMTQVIIRNIGQGNWNEIRSDKRFALIFDAGTIYTTKRTDIFRLIGNRDNEYQKSNPIIIISHWDVDHYHFLIGFQDDTIRSIPCFIYRAAIPNLTARKILGRFRTLNSNALLPIAPIDPHPLRSSTKLRKFNFTTTGNIIFFNAYKNRSRNKSGFGLALRKKNTSVVFSGDYDYKQVSDHILSELNYPCNHYLIVPHHGGKAGKFSYNNSKLNKLKKAIISVGVNPYKPPHPYSVNINDLKSKGFDIVRTDLIQGDYIINV